jgi:iron complex transport system substrate-binding protein
MRVVSLLPSATEILFAIGAGEQVVGVTHECDFPRSATTRPIVTFSHLPADLDAAGIDRHVRASLHAGSSLYGLDEAKLGALAPDLILTQELCTVCAVSYEIVARAAKRLGPANSGGPAVVSLEPSSLEDVFATIAYVGKLVDAEEGAQALLHALHGRVAALEARRREGRRPRVLVLEWTDPPMSGGHWTPGLVELAGGDPILADPGANSRVLAWEAIVAADPDLVLVAPCGYGLEKALAALDALPAHAAAACRSLRAFAAGRIYAVDGNAYVNRPGPRLVDTAELFAAAIREEPAPYAGAVARWPPVARNAVPTR